MLPRRFSTNFALFALFLDALLIFTTYRTSVFVVAQPVLEQPHSLLVVAIWAGALLVAAAYDPDKTHKAIDEFQLVFLAHGFAVLLFAGCLYVLAAPFARARFAIFALLSFFALAGWRVLARLFFRMGDRLWQRTRVAIVGMNDVGRELVRQIDEVSDDRLEVVGYIDDAAEQSSDDLPLLGQFEQIVDVVKSERIEDVIITLPGAQYELISQIIYGLHRLPVQVHVVPDYFNLAMYRARVDNFGGFPMINLRAPALNAFQRMIKRLLDFLLSLSLLLLLSLPMLLIALLLRLDTSGPILFRQRRIGENGRIFTMYKFRTMIAGAEKMQVKVHKQRRDPRVTAVGSWLRRTSLDELPQLLNVLRGDMSLVGPRPELPWLVDRYATWQRTRFAVPQGITGWWQVNGRSDRPMHLHTEDDLYYIQNYSLWLDIYILLKTPLVVLRGNGAF